MDKVDVSEEIVFVWTCPGCGDVIEECDVIAGDVVKCDDCAKKFEVM